ncbi:MAG: flagellar biosynthetic protein FliO [Labilithrix sp.]|nr:flagellar biosynthetic protein FliO [Labilithrix sp.]
MKRALSTTVMALTLAVTGPALADAPAQATETHTAAPTPPAPAPEPAPAPAPLALRPGKPVTFSSEPTSTPWFYKVAFATLLGAAGFVAWRKRRRDGKAVAKPATVRVVGRTAMGLRGELAVVEVGGMRLLVGVTPSSMQTLAILDGHDDAVDAPSEATAPQEIARQEPAARTKTASEIGARARALFGGLDLGPAASAPPAPAAPAPARSSARAAFATARYADDDDLDPIEPAPAPKPRAQSRKRAPREIEGQARGLSLALGGKR